MYTYDNGSKLAETDQRMSMQRYDAHIVNRGSEGSVDRNFLVLILRTWSKGDDEYAPCRDLIAVQSMVSGIHVVIHVVIY